MEHFRLRGSGGWNWGWPDLSIWDEVDHGIIFTKRLVGLLDGARKTESRLVPRGTLGKRFGNFGWLCYWLTYENLYAGMAGSWAGIL